MNRDAHYRSNSDSSDGSPKVVHRGHALGLGLGSMDLSLQHSIGSVIESTARQSEVALLITGKVS